jgi:hypothetical protein
MNPDLDLGAPAHHPRTTYTRVGGLDHARTPGTLVASGADTMPR